MLKRITLENIIHWRIFMSHVNFYGAQLLSFNICSRYERNMALAFPLINQIYIPYYTLLYLADRLVLG